MTGVELLVLGWFASPVIKRVVEKAHNLLRTNYELPKGTRGSIETLTSTLALCQATVEEAEKRMINNSNLTNWLKTLKEAVYNAEDVLDNIEAKSIKEKVQEKNKVSKFVSSSVDGFKNMFFLDENHKSLKKAVEQLGKLSEDITKFVSLVSMNENYGSNNHEVTDPRETISQPLGELYGRQDELNLILEIILGRESESTKKKYQNYNTYDGLFVLPIVGMGGVGKTALAQAVYNDPGVQQAFQLKSWISISCNLDVIQLMRKIIQSLGGYLRLDVITLEEISKNIFPIIGQVKFLVVLDNTSEKIESQWAVIYKILSRGAPGSVVLITTQNHEFTNRVATCGHVALDALEGDIFWELFEHFAFGNLVMSEDKRFFLESIGKKIANNLRGLPLAAKIIGNVLRTNLDEQRWRRISKSEWWDIPEGKSQILPSIGVGYEHLNPCLRQCFAYCSVFPRNSIIEKDRVVQMWIAQNFIPQDVNGARPEDVGRQWFDNLVAMSFFQPVVDNKGYVLHDLMHDLAIIVSSNECFYLNDESVEIPLGIRHLAVDTKNLEVLKTIPKHNNLRSFFYFGSFHVEGMYSTINEALCNLNSIRVLDLSYLHMETEEPPTAIQNFTHLRFLDLSNTEIEVLSHSSFDHYHLQALHIKKCKNLQLPKGINKLINLRHLNADAETIAQISGIGKLTNLQELNIYAVRKQEGHRISELRNLREITGHLKIDMCENIISKDEALQANLFDKKHLDSVEICWNSGRRKSNINLKILEGLQPPGHINELKINCYLGPSFPDWMMQVNHFENLQKVHLFACDRTEMLPPLGQLPSLKSLLLEGLHSIKIIDNKLYGNNQTVFPVLREFVFISDCCEEWTAAQNGEFFPRLSSLDINGCPVLRQLPLHCLGASLKNFKMHNCQEFYSLERSLHYLFSLTRLHITHSAMSVSLKFSSLICLEELILRDCQELSIEGDFKSLTNLKYLYIRSCPNLLSKRQLKGKGLHVHQGEGLRSLNCLDMDFLNLEYHLILDSLPSLKILSYNSWKFNQFTEYQTLWFQEITTLEELIFLDCKFEHLPSNLATLSSLKKVTLNSCIMLESLPENGMPPFLCELSLTGCSQNLVQRCQPNGGEDWHLLSHVSFIRIDGRIISKPQISGETSGNVSVTIVHAACHTNFFSRLIGAIYLGQ